MILLRTRKDLAIEALMGRNSPRVGYFYNNEVQFYEHFASNSASGQPEAWRVQLKDSALVESPPDSCHLVLEVLSLRVHEQKCTSS